MESLSYDTMRISPTQFSNKSRDVLLDSGVNRRKCKFFIYCHLDIKIAKFEIV